MVQINVTSGQGITQAIASQLGMSKTDCKKVSLAQWQNVMTLVDQNNTQNKTQNKQSIFTGGNDVQNINNKANWKTDFVVQPNQTIEIEESFWQKIKNILGSGAPKTVDNTANTTEQTVEQVSESKQPAAVSKEDIVTTEQGAAFEEFNNVSSSDNEKSFDVLGDDWRQLANKKGKSQEEITRMQNEYQQGFLKFGESYMKHIDKAYGNGDGILTEEEYVASETDILPDEYKQDEEFRMGAVNTFNHIDLNKDGKIDKKEMAALMSMFDMDVNNGGINGKIKVYDQTANALNLIKPSTEKDGQAMDRKLTGMYEFLFGKTEK